MFWKAYECLRGLSLKDETYRNEINTTECDENALSVYSINKPSGGVKKGEAVKKREKFMCFACNEIGHFALKSPKKSSSFFKAIHYSPVLHG